MDWVLYEVLEALCAKVILLVISHISLLLKDVVKAGCPFPAAQACCVAAVVYHESDPPCMHVGVEGVNSLQKER